MNGWGNLEIGRNSWVGQYNNFRLSDQATILVGNDCLISQFCSLVASNHDTRGHHLMSQRPPDGRKLGVRIEDGVWLGAGCVVLPGVSIGQGAVIGSNSVVTADVPAFEIWAGLPARKIGERTEVVAP
jgi:acetyltransferase-like isoleucine patch superfamily enzyme